VKTMDGKLDFKGSDENQAVAGQFRAHTDPVTGSFAVPVPTDGRAVVQHLQDAIQRGPGKF